MAYIGQEPGQGQAERFIFTASGSETVVSTADDGRVIGYTAGQVSVYLNGVKLVVGTDCIATNGSTITGLSALSASDVVEVIALSAFSPSDTVSASGGTFTGAVTFSGAVSMQSANNQGFASGTKMIFNQTAAPTGWTKVTSSNDVALRLTSGTVGTGGSIAFETAFASQTVPVHALTTAEIPGHTHTIGFNNSYSSSYTTVSGGAWNSASHSYNSGSTGGGNSHGHGSLNLDVSYVDVIIATKD